MSTSTAHSYSLIDRDRIIGELSNRYELRVKDLPDSDKPRERLQAAGPAGLSVAELLAVVWGVGSQREDVLAMARRTLREYGEKTLSHEPKPQRLAVTANIPLVKACQLVAAFELGRRFYGTKSSGRPLQVRTARQAYQYLNDMSQSSKEQLRGLYLNSRFQVIHDEVISVGSVTSNIVHPREVFHPAIERHAVAVIIAHNHPSGSLEPTLADISVTEQLLAAGEVLGIELLDHLIIAPGKYASVMDCIKREGLHEDL